MKMIVLPLRLLFDNLTHCWRGTLHVVVKTTKRKYKNGQIERVWLRKSGIRSNYQITVTWPLVLVDTVLVTVTAKLCSSNSDIPLRVYSIIRLFYKLKIAKKLNYLKLPPPFLAPPPTLHKYSRNKLCLHVLDVMGMYLHHNNFYHWKTSKLEFKKSVLSKIVKGPKKNQQIT